MAKKGETQIISLSEADGKKIVKINQCELEDELVYNFFKSNEVKKTEYDTMFKKALHIGILALQEDRIQHFLTQTESNLGVELMNLRHRYDLNQSLLKAAQVKGEMAEVELVTVLNSFFEERKLKDEAYQTGSTPRKGKNKTGDLVCYIRNDDGTDTRKKIGIESKLNASVGMGDIKKFNPKESKTDTAWSQLIETDYNRDSQVSIMVFDVSCVKDEVKNTIGVTYIPQVGFVVVVDMQAGRFENLYIAYLLARDIAMNAKSTDYDPDLMKIMVNRIIKDVKEIQTIKDMVEKNIKINEDSNKNNQKILDQLKKNLKMMEFNQKYLEKFLQEGTLSKADLFNFYQGCEIDESERLIELEVKDTYK